jgi:hypothetical protein
MTQLAIETEPKQTNKQISNTHIIFVNFPERIKQNIHNYQILQQPPPPKKNTFGGFLRDGV